MRRVKHELKPQLQVEYGGGRKVKQHPSNVTIMQIKQTKQLNANSIQFCFSRCFFTFYSRICQFLPTKDFILTFDLLIKNIYSVYATCRQWVNSSSGVYHLESDTQVMILNCCFAAVIFLAKGGVAKRCSQCLDGEFPKATRECTLAPQDQ